jgi:site-specific recombinase XerD
MESGYFSEWLKSYRNYLRMRNYSPRTIDSYGQVIRHFAYYVWLRRHTDVTKLVIYWKDFENARMDTGVEVTPIIITDFLSFVSSMRTYKPKTFHRIISTLSSFYRYLYTQGAVTTNPLTGIDRPRIKQQEVKYLKHNQVLRLLDSIEDPRDKLIVRTIYATGVRVSELCNMNIEDPWKRRQDQNRFY